MIEVSPPNRQVRAVFDDETITVYQAFDGAIAGAALEAQHFVAPFSRTRMTWIKPSFLWMMYRCGWATKPGQERVLAVRIRRMGFEEALARSCLSHFDPDVYAGEAEWRQRRDATTVRVQWDPERDGRSEPLPWRSLQLGIGGGAVASYVDDWTVSIEDITARVERLRDVRCFSGTDLPREQPYPLKVSIAHTIGASIESVER